MPAPVPALVRIALFGSGAGTTAAAVMEVVAAELPTARVCLVLGNNSRSGVLEGARERGVPALHLSSATHPDPDELDVATVSALDGAGADLIVLAGYLKKLGPQVLARYAGRIVNTHPALLPAYGGVGMYGDRVHAAVLADGATVTGASVHAVTAEYDEGPVLAQARVPVLPDDDVPSLRARVQAAEKELLLGWLREWCASGGWRPGQ
ncbi:phosphoribosylglycinamide formyltransferase [Antribacter gilvus]|uniref:phosphoribosylglycinamide formyltransferase n=1 Tax=Antribacter gilvus TaxID=2304675 RepID=UPI000F7A2862|nr:phosphoribosylglycinamide formyltransferase [Antribacter gilvus]